MAPSLHEVLIRLSRALGSLALEPSIPALILAILHFGPSIIKDGILDYHLLKDPTNLSRFEGILCTLLVLGILRRLNEVLNELALNNWNLWAPRGWDWHHELAVVTGGCSGIGKEIVLGLAAKGVTVAIFDIQPLPKDLQVLSSLEKKIFHFQCDVTSSASVREACSTIRKELGHPSILVNNAGILNRSAIIDTTEEQIRRIIGVNLESLWNTTRELLPTMIQQNKGHVVTMASLASFVSLAGSVDYSATKSGAMAFHQGLQAEIRHVYKAPGIISTIAHPSFVATPLTAPHAAKISKRMGKMLEPQDVAKPILRQIFRRRGAQLIIPYFTSRVTGLYGWPNWMQEKLRSAMARAA